LFRVSWCNVVDTFYLVTAFYKGDPYQRDNVKCKHICIRICAGWLIGKITWVTRSVPNHRHIMHLNEMKLSIIICLYSMMKAVFEIHIITQRRQRWHETRQWWIDKCKCMYTPHVEGPHYFGNHAYIWIQVSSLSACYCY
jgi:hypothetical protein